MRKFLNSALAVAASVLMVFSMSAVAQSMGSSASTSQNNTSNSAQSDSSEQGMNTSVKSASKSKSPDEQFLKRAAEGGQLEVQLAPIAEQNAQSQEVKDFAKRMMTDHSKANDQLKQVAEKMGVTLPDQPNAKQQAKLDHLKQLQGAQFDKAYMAYMVKDHTHDVAEFRKQASSAKDPQVKQFASQTLPVLESHLKEAKNVDAKVKSESASNSGNGSPAQTASNTKKQKY